MDTTDADAQAPLTIGDLAERTGLNPATLRMWEERHGFPVPHRLESGHRRYTEADVAVVEAVLRRKDAGTRLQLAIAQAMADATPAAPSVYAYLRRRHPHLGVHRLKKSTLLALSWAIEDEFCSKADRAVVYGAFQAERFYRASRSRWTELAGISAGATALADFAASDSTAAPAEVALAADAPMRREWAVVCDASDLPVVLTAWQLPGQEDVPDRHRLFESMWAVDRPAVHDAGRVCASVARAADPTWDDSVAGRAAAEAATHEVEGVAPDAAAMGALFNRMVAYVDRGSDG